jgi:hypothetical protein
MKWYAIIVVAASLAACSGEADQHEAADGSSAPAPAERSDAPQTPSDASDADGGVDMAVEMIDVDAGTLPDHFQYTGQIAKVKRWRDANGFNTVIVSEKSTEQEDFTYQEIFAYLYVGDGGSVDQFWDIQDNAENMCDQGHGLVSDIIVEDVDADGLAESAFVYSVWGSCDVSPVPYKLIMHGGDGTKYAIRGTSGVRYPDGRTEGKKNFDAAFDSAPEGFRTWASALWDKHVPSDEYN